MGGTSTSVYEFDSVVRAHHVYKTVLLNSFMKHCKCMVWEDTNEHFDYVVDNRLPREDAYLATYQHIRYQEYAYISLCVVPS